MINRDELLKMAREAGFCFHDAGYAPTLHTLPEKYSEKCFERFKDKILERAAVERENKLETESMHATSRDCANFNTGVHACIDAIRTLKKQGE